MLLLLHLLPPTRAPRPINNDDRLGGLISCVDLGPGQECRLHASLHSASVAAAPSTHSNSWRSRRRAMNRMSPAVAHAVLSGLSSRDPHGCFRPVAGPRQRPSSPLSLSNLLPVALVSFDSKHNKPFLEKCKTALLLSFSGLRTTRRDIERMPVADRSRRFARSQPTLPLPSCKPTELAGQSRLDRTENLTRGARPRRSVRCQQHCLQGQAFLPPYPPV